MPIGSLIFVNFSVQMLVDILSVRYADRIGYRKLMAGAHLLCLIGFILISAAVILPLRLVYWGLIMAVVFYSFGGGLLEVLVSPLLQQLPGDVSTKPSEMSFLHAAFCCGQVIVILTTTLILRGTGASIWWVLPLLWAVVPMFNLFLTMSVPMPKTKSEANAVLSPSPMKNPLLLTLCVAMMCAGALELIMAQVVHN
jgi:MFS family permease